MKILFVHYYPTGQLSSFVQTDLDLLREQYSVTELSLTPWPWSRSPLATLAAWRLVAQHDLVFGWFGSTNQFSYLARVLGRRSCIVAGGEDVTDQPQINYGLSSFNRRFRWRMLLGYRLTDRVLLFSDSSRKELMAHPFIKPSNLQTLHLGVDLHTYKPGGEKKRQVLTISYLSGRNMRRKGIRTFIDVARLCPDITFKLGGRVLDHALFQEIEDTRPANLILLGELSPAALLEEYQQAKVYAQLSWHEGFGMALAEAMACGCIPVVTNRGSLPEVAGPEAFYVPIEDPNAAMLAVEKAIDSTEVMAKQAYQHIATRFSLQHRRKQLFETINKLIAKR